jgi:hypothetical protein
VIGPSIAGHVWDRRGPQRVYCCFHAGRAEGPRPSAAAAAKRRQVAARAVRITRIGMQRAKPIVKRLTAGIVTARANTGRCCLVGIDQRSVLQRGPASSAGCGRLDRRGSAAGADSQHRQSKERGQGRKGSVGAIHRRLLRCLEFGGREDPPRVPPGRQAGGALGKPRVEGRLAVAFSLSESAALAH